VKDNEENYYTGRTQPKIERRNKIIQVVCVKLIKTIQSELDHTYKPIK